MKEHMFYIIGMFISGSVFMSLSFKYHWSIKLWTVINMKIKSTWNVILWLLLAVLFQIIVQIALEPVIYSKELMQLFIGISMGLTFAFMPSVQK